MNYAEKAETNYPDDAAFVVDTLQAAVWLLMVLGVEGVGSEQAKERDLAVEVDDGVVVGLEQATCTSDSAAVAVNHGSS